jgi:CRISPR/Cas system endoribonuclease Cas6 (RAMP superfamily)
MPVTLRLLLLPEADVCLRGQNAPNHGWFLNLMRLVQDYLGPDSSLPFEGDLHGVPPHGVNRTLRPYSLSPFYTPTRLSLVTELPDALEPCLRVRHGQPLALRISFLDDRIAHRLLTYLGAVAPHQSLLALPRLGHDPRFQTASQGAPQPGAACKLLTLPLSAPHPDLLPLSWKELADSAPRSDYPLRWSSPTLFQRNGKDLALTSPQELLAGWLETLHTLADQLPESAPLRALTITQPERLHWQSRTLTPTMFRLKGGVRTAYQGGATLAWEPATTREDQIATHALLRFATLAGTGAKTTMGLGQTYLS